jgi:hypothetical protein
VTFHISWSSPAGSVMLSDSQGSTETSEEHEFLALPHADDPREATYVGKVATPSPKGYLAQRPL